MTEKHWSIDVVCGLLLFEKSANLQDANYQDYSRCDGAQASGIGEEYLDSHGKRVSLLLSDVSYALNNRNHSSVDEPAEDIQE